MLAQHNSFVDKVITSLISLFFLACADPVEPEFQFKEGLVYIEALASSKPGTSYVTITRSEFEFGIYKNIFLQKASVSFINTETQSIVTLSEKGAYYLPPDNFKADIGDTWELEVKLPDGTRYRSEPETIESPVAIKDLKVAYEPELNFNVALDTYIPGHRILVGFDDPVETENYYYWRYRTYEKLVQCRVCYSGYFRDGECRLLPPANPPLGKPYYTYFCESDCWQIRYVGNINIFSDKFSNGTGVSKLPIADIPLYTKRDILVELQQFSISASAYHYLQTLKDIIDDNSGLNAPLPAALVGNLYNPDNKDEFVLGRFTAAATTTKSIFITRTFVEDTPLEPVLKSQAEGFGDPVPSPNVLSVPCEESRYRTGVRPEGWVD